MTVCFNYNEFSWFFEQIRIHLETKRINWIEFFHKDVWDTLKWLTDTSQGRIQDFFRRGCTRLALALLPATPINHIVFFLCRIPLVLENRRSSQGGGRTPCTLPLDPLLRQQSRSQKELRGLFLLFYLFVSKVAIPPNSPIVLFPYNITFSSAKLLYKHCFQFASLKTRRLDRAAFAMISGSATRDKENQKTRT